LGSRIQLLGVPLKYGNSALMLSPKLNLHRKDAKIAKKTFLIQLVVFASLASLR
jgi:hypothetical protein